MVMYFENLIIELYILYSLNTYVNWMLFTIWFINLFFIHNFKLQKLKFKHLIDNITIDLLFFWNFASMEDIIRTCNLIFRFTKFTSNKMIFTEFERFLFKLIWREIFFLPGGITWQCAHIDALKKKKEYLCFDPNGDSQILNTVIWCPWRIKNIIFKIVEFWKI